MDSKKRDKLLYLLGFLFIYLIQEKKGKIMKKFRYYVSLEGLIFTFALLSLFIIGCASESDKRIETSEGLYRQSIEYKGKNKPIMAQIKLEEALREYQTIIVNFPNHAADIGYDLYQMWEENYKPPEPAKPDYEAAGLILEKLAENFPKGFWTSRANTSLWFIAADEKDKHNYEDARRAYLELVDNFPKDRGISIAWYGLGEVNYKLEKYEETRKAFREFISQSRVLNSYMGREARRLIAQSYLDQEYYHQAYLNFDKLTTVAFKDNTKLQAEAMYKAAHCLMLLEVNDEALGRYTEFMTRFPDSKYITDAYFDLGSLYAYNKKDYELARFNYNRALQSPESPNYSKAKIQLEIGWTYYYQDNFKKASNVCNQLLQEYPESDQVSMARLLIAHIHRKEKRVDEAIRAYEGIIANHAEGKPVYFDFNMDDGLSLPGNLIATSYSEIGAAFSIKKDFERAFNSYARIVKKPDGEEVDFRKDPIAPFALRGAMVALRELGRKDKLETFATTYINALGNINALSDHELILSAEAQLKFADILREFADILREERKQDDKAAYDKASAEYAKLQDYPPKQHLRLELIKLRAKYYEGQCYEKLSTLDKSTEAYQEVIRLFEAIFRPLIDNPHINVPNIIAKEKFDYCIRTARYYVGNSYFATNQFKKAIDEFEEFLKRVDPENQKFEKLKEMIKTARDKIEEANHKLGAKAKRPKSSSNASDKFDSSKKSKIGTELTAKDIAEIASGSTVFIEMKGILEYESGKRIEGRAGSGSGFFVDHGLIATNYHVIKIEPSYFPWNKKDDGKDEVVSIHPLEKGSTRLVGTDKEYAIVGYTVVDPDRDLAILKVRAFGVKPIPLGNSDEVNQGDAVCPVGNPLGLVNVVSDGQISSIQWVESIRSFLTNRSKLVKDVQRNDTPHKLLMMTAPISGGNSGGPVLNNKGEVIGISVGHKGGGQNLNYAIPVNYLKALLKRTGPPKPLSDLEIAY